MADHLSTTTCIEVIWTLNVPSSTKFHRRIFNLKMSLQNRKRRAICYNSETDSEVENDLTKNKRDRKNGKKLRTLNSSESEDSDVHEETTCGKIIWSYENLKPQVHKFDSHNSGMTIQLNRSATPIDYFQLFFCEELVSFIVEKTNEYRKFMMDNSKRSFLKPHERETTLSEIYNFFVIRLLMSRVKKLHFSEYWTKDKFLRTDVFGKIMNRDRYVFLLRILYFSKIELVNSDRLIKIREFCNKLCRSFQNCFIPFRYLCVDESLLLKGRLSFQQYVPSKRNMFDIKSFVLCDCKTGFVLNFVAYADSDSEITKMNEKYLGKSAEVVLTLLNSYLGKGHTLFVDNWYTSPTLFSYLHDNKTNACGTVKPRRREMPVMKEKLNKGEICFRSSSNMLALKWQDKREVYMLSTSHSADYINTKKINYQTGEIIQKPSCIVDYIANMGVVNNRDKVISSVQSVRKGVKWYKIYFFHLLDVAIWNAYCLYKLQEKEKVTMRAFHLRLLKEIFEKFGYTNNNISSNKSIADHPFRLSGKHFPSYCRSTKSKKALRNCIICSKNDVRRRSRYECEDCDVGLCVIPCFKIYHTQLYY
ncbi:piggyBac transposable element-derived protein 4-like isoform X2 [Bombus flavifrons]